MSRRLTVKKELIAWVQDVGGEGDVYGIGDEWDFDFPLPHVKLAWQIMRMTQRVPTYDEVVQHDPRWLTDIFLMDKLYRWTHNKSLPQGIAPKKPGGEVPDPAHGEPPAKPENVIVSGRFGA